ncbi:MAG: hypothetical protein R3362_02095, partial [Rhodothermales bacterium]|nr:hypothetical protein [Rhodothermales bacterium]
LLAGDAAAERVGIVEAGVALPLGPFDLAVRAQALERREPRLLLLDPDVARFVTGDGAFRSAVATLALGWRRAAARGLYAEAEANAHAFLDADATPLHARAAGALPDGWGRVRLGVRGRNLFDGALDLDLALQGRGWTAFRGRGLHAPTALYGLPPPTAAPVPASGTLDGSVEASLGGGRARVFVVYENALGGRVGDPAYVVPVYPLPGPRLRFGVFWVLAN